MTIPTQAGKARSGYLNGSDQRTLDGESMAAADYLAPRSLRPHILMSACFLLPIAGCSGVWAATFNVGQLNTMMANGGVEASLAPAFGAVTGFLLLSWIVVSFRPLRESLADGAIVVESQGGAARAVCESIRDSAVHRCQEPFRFEPRELEDFPGIAVRNGSEHGLITTRVVGPDLLVCWSLWRRRSTARLVSQVLDNLLQRAADSPYAVAAASSFVAMREQLQCIARQGIEAGVAVDDR